MVPARRCAILDGAPEKGPGPRAMLSRPSGSSRPLCPVCGEVLLPSAITTALEPAPAGALCRCARCQAPAHTDCFGWAGGCATFGCGSSAAHLDRPPPAGWRPDPARGDRKGTWLVPTASERSGSPALPFKGASLQCLRYWTGCGPLEVLSLIGRGWLSAVCILALGVGIWHAPLPVGLCIGLVLASHLNAMAGLARLWFSLGLGAPDESKLLGERMRLMAGRRLATIERSRALLVLSLVVLVVGLLTLEPSSAGWPIGVVLVTAVLPWLSLVPRWRIEAPFLLALARASPHDPRPPALPPASGPAGEEGTP